MQKMTYRQEHVRCGKQHCRTCQEGKGHGPYWYAYWNENGRTMSKYIGAHLPGEIEKQQLKTEEKVEEYGKNRKITYLQQYIRCGKQHCRTCQEGKGHGPYWYAYWSENGRTMSKYIGAHLPGEIEKQQLKTEEDSSSKPVLRIYVLGQFRVERRSGFDWQVISRIWQRRRARVLLGCLLSSPGRQLGREQIMKTLWPNLASETAANRLNGAVHELRQILEPEIARPANSRMLRLERNVLKLANQQQIWVDAEEFEDQLNMAIRLKDSERAEQLLKTADALYIGDYLPEELYAGWADSRREALRNRLMELLLNLAEKRAGRGALPEAIEPLNRILSIVPTHETTIRYLMVLLMQLNRRGEALRLYHQFALLLQKEGEREPLPETHEIYEALRKGHINPSVQEKLVKSLQLPAISVLQLSTHPNPTSRRGYRLSTFIGREQELDQLQHILQSVAGDSSDHYATKSEPFGAPLLLLMGEAGIGKTRLAEELSLEAEANTWLVAWSRANEQERTIFFRPWIEILRTLLASYPVDQLIADLKAAQQAEEALHAKFERLCSLLPELSASFPASKHYLYQDPELERLYLWEATMELLQIISQKAPLLLVLDDLHWIDDSSLDLLAYVVRHLQNQRILLIGTYRKGEIAPTHKLHSLIADLQRERAIVTLSLQPLTESQIGSLVSHLPEEIVRSIQTRAGGNPLFAEELARYSSINIEQANRAEGNPIHTATSLPTTIAGVLDRRLNKLSTECQALLGKAVVLGGFFELNLLLLMVGDQEISNEDMILDLLEEAMGAGIISEKGAASQITYHFWHPLVVSHLYERQSVARRAQLHKRAAQALMKLHQGHESDVAAKITNHLSRGGDPEEIAYYAEISGNQAYAIGAYAEARHYYRQTIQALLPPQEGDILLDRCNVVLENIDSLHVIHLLERLAEIAMIQSSFEEGRRFYECVLKLRGQRPVAGKEAHYHKALIQALILREIGRAWSEIGETAKCYACFQHGKRVLREVGALRSPAWGALHLQEANMLLRQGRYEEGRQYASEALQMLEESEELRNVSEAYTITERRALGRHPLDQGLARETLAIANAELGQFSEAIVYFRAALEIFEKHTLVAAATRVSLNFGTVYAVMFQYAEAQKYLEHSYEMAVRIGDQATMAYAMGNLGELVSNSGKLLEAESFLQRALVLDHKMGEPEHAAWCHAMLASLLLEQGKLQEARQNLCEAFKRGKPLQYPKVISMILLVLGNFRMSQAATVLSVNDVPYLLFHEPASRRLLLRARASIRHGLRCGGLEIEVRYLGELLLARVTYLLGDLETARDQALKIYEEAREHKLSRVIVQALVLLGCLFEETQAEQYFKDALLISRTLGMRLYYARALGNYGLLLLRSEKQGKNMKQQGLAMLREAREIFTTCNASIDRMYLI